jgi:hypothetical protein
MLRRQSDVPHQITTVAVRAVAERAGISLPASSAIVPDVAGKIASSKPAAALASSGSQSFPPSSAATEC